jgi:hypothetical protein
MREFKTRFGSDIIWRFFEVAILHILYIHYRTGDFEKLFSKCLKTSKGHSNDNGIDIQIFYVFFFGFFIIMHYYFLLYCILYMDHV